MQRTTIMLPAALRHKAMEKAKTRGISLGELIRQALESIVSRRSGDSLALDPLFADKTTFKGKSPKDLAKNHDDYLYGDDE